MSENEKCVKCGKGDVEYEVLNFDTGGISGLCEHCYGAYERMQKEAAEVKSRMYMGEDDWG